MMMRFRALCVLLLAASLGEVAIAHAESWSGPLGDADIVVDLHSVTPWNREDGRSAYSAYDGTPFEDAVYSVVFHVPMGAAANYKRSRHYVHCVGDEAPMMSGSELDENFVAGKRQDATDYRTEMQDLEFFGTHGSDFESAARAACGAARTLKVQ